jgi:predicted nucleic acid-binding protein
LSAYVDTSVLAAYYFPERSSSVVDAMLRRLSPPTISPLVEVELHSAISQKLRARQIDAAMATRVVVQFRSHVADGLYERVAIGAREYALASEWIARFEVSLRALDALHLAAASTHHLRLLTADQALAKAAERFDVECRLIR